MTPAFGFSAGDFISAINLIRKVSHALKDVGGASSEYQAVVVELQGLQNVLQQLEALEPNQDNVGHVNAIRGMALACQLPLREFMKKLEKYEDSLGPWGDRSSYRGTGRKAKWAVSFAKEVEKLRAIVAAKHISISLLLAMNNSKTLSDINLRSKQDHSDLMNRAVEHQNVLNDLSRDVEHAKQRVTEAEIASRDQMGTISTQVDETQATVLSLRSVGEQILAHVRILPQEIRELLQGIMNSNWKIYQLLLQLDQRIPQTPSCFHNPDLTIKFENALGEVKVLPYEIFRHWEPFEGLVRSQFKNQLGENKIISGQYHIIDVERQGAIIPREDWTRAIRCGASVSMSVVMSRLQKKAGSCPRPECPGIGLTKHESMNALKCGSCNLVLYCDSSILEDNLSRITVLEEDEDIAKRQAAEDLQLYGSRSEPQDTIDVDEEILIARLPPKRNASEFAEAVDRPAKIRKRAESKRYNYQTVTAMDWNSGASPLDAWLNQSAVPSLTLLPDQLKDHDAPSQDLTAQEIAEIKAFRNVHIMNAPLSSNQNEKSVILDEMAGLEFEAQIFYRNIKDRYPLLPGYLARRLAKANHKRAERLRNQRSEKERVAKSLLGRHHAKIDQERAERAERVRTQRSEKQVVAELKKLESFYNSPFDHIDLDFPQRSLVHVPSPKLPLPIANVARIMKTALPKDAKILKEAKECMQDCVTEFICFITSEAADLCQQEKRGNLLGEDILLAMHKTGFENYAMALRSYLARYREPVVINSRDKSRSDFWTGGRTPRRRGSHSSRNSSLHGRSAPNPEDQDPVFNEQTITRTQSVGLCCLPPPPGELGKKPSIECHICGETVYTSRRLEWQKHVLSDLRPYSCTVFECNHPDKTFVSRWAFLEHELFEHDRWQEFSCLFCGEMVNLTSGTYHRHVGRHMEEIAFTVVSKPYEEWDFYSDISGEPAQPEAF